ncbi:hypothetical protein ID866_6680 [Astraeus odoratus]|nr:hypothetical protein ID866_6680 [Astraeus odoratus]
MRQLIRYDLDDSPGPSKLPGTGSPVRPPSKKRKHTHHRGRGGRPSRVPHWDDPGNIQDEALQDEQEGDVPYENGDLEVEEETEESRELTYEEIWDDSALIEAWNSAQAEYEVGFITVSSCGIEAVDKEYHGNSEDWKKDPVKKSPLWYNIPYTSTTSQAAKGKNSKTSGASPVEDEDNTAPIDFHTFVPTHDPSLPASPEFKDQLLPTASSTQVRTSGFLPPASTSMISRDEAFNNALSAMYWSGYWTAVYHCQSQPDRGRGIPDEGQADDTEDGRHEESDSGDVELDEEDLVPTQR